MSFRNAVILSFCIAAGLEVFSGCAYNDKYVEIVLVDSGRQPESVPSQSQNHIPADTGNEANSVYAPEEVTYDGVGKAEEKQEQRPKKSAKPTALPDVTPRLCPQLRRRLLLRLCQRPCPRRNPRLPQRGRLDLQTRRSPRRTHWKKSTATSWLQKTPGTMNGKGR